MTKFRMEHIMGKHRVEHFTLHFDAVIAQYIDIVFKILTDFQNIRVFIYLFENINNF